MKKTWKRRRRAWRLVIGERHADAQGTGRWQEYPGGALGRLSTRHASGIWVHEMLVNYQGCASDYMCVQTDPDSQFEITLLDP